MRRFVVPILLSAYLLSAGGPCGTAAQADPSCETTADASSAPQSRLGARTGSTPANGARLHVPEGFAVEPVAGDLGVRFPMFAVFADDGRLFVAESSGNDLYAELQASARNSRIRVLEDGW